MRTPATIPDLALRQVRVRPERHLGPMPDAGTDSSTLHDPAAPGESTRLAGARPDGGRSAGGGPAGGGPGDPDWRRRVARARALATTTFGHTRRRWQGAHPNTRGAVAVVAAAVVSLAVVALIIPAGAPQAQTPPGPPVTVPTRAATTLVCPVAGTYTFRDDFAEPRSGKRTHHGNDVFAAKGTPLVAIVGGTIEKAVPTDDGTLGGARIWIAGDDGWHYYYAHMSRVDVQKGQQVAAGQAVGLVGNTGDAKTTPPHLHFEQHFTKIDGPFVNPHATLAAACVNPVAKLPPSALAAD